MWLLIAILKNETVAEKMLSAMLELELTDTAVIDGEAVENLAARSFALFSEVGRLFSERLRYNRVLLCRLPDRSAALDLQQLCRDDGIDLHDSQTGFFLLVPCADWPES